MLKVWKNINLGIPFQGQGMDDLFFEGDIEVVDTSSYKAQNEFLQYARPVWIDSWDVPIGTIFASNTTSFESTSGDRYSIEVSSSHGEELRQYQDARQLTFTIKLNDVGTVTTRTISWSSNRGRLKVSIFFGVRQQSSSYGTITVATLYENDYDGNARVCNHHPNEPWDQDNNTTTLYNWIHNALVYGSCGGGAGNGNISNPRLINKYMCSHGRKTNEYDYKTIQPVNASSENITEDALKIGNGGARIKLLRECSKFELVPVVNIDVTNYTFNMPIEVDYGNYLDASYIITSGLNLPSVYTSEITQAPYEYKSSDGVYEQEPPTLSSFYDITNNLQIKFGRDSGLDKLTLRVKINGSWVSVLNSSVDNSAGSGKETKVSFIFMLDHANGEATVYHLIYCHDTNPSATYERVCYLYGLSRSSQDMAYRQTIYKELAGTL